jgi:hypothetical protein
VLPDVPMCLVGVPLEARNGHLSNVCTLYGSSRAGQAAYKLGPANDSALKLPAPEGR